MSHELINRHNCGVVGVAVNGNVRSIPTTEMGWVNDGLDIRSMLAAEFDLVRDGKLAREKTSDIIAEGTFWATYRQRA